ncbi:phosphoribosylglycinamide formyltransferase [Flavobacterium sp.]|uniref:phosphoribosylglycinamide formyltransferase n=1 Tax=Flavobacterium sp. TaxID=239 RepID=UPI0039E24FE1
MKKIVLFASGSGSNVENIIQYFRQNQQAEVVAVFCNNPKAKVIARAESLKVPVVLFSKEELLGESVLLKLHAFHPDLIVLAGFLLQFPLNIIQAYPDRIVNIHPALLPKYGGKGMYGMHVHRAVIENKETETGISIHYIDEHYDEGDIIFQKSTALNGSETAEEIAAKVHELEHRFFPMVIEQLILHS